MVYTLTLEFFKCVCFQEPLLMRLTPASRFTVLAQRLTVALLTSVLLVPVALAERGMYMKDAPLEEIIASPATYAAQYVKPVGLGGGTFSKLPEVKSLGKVAVTGFQVMFQSQRKVQEEGSTLKGVTQGKWQDARWQVDVNGLTPELMQAITEAAYKNFVADLEKAGYEVIPTETLLANADYNALVEGSTEANVVKSGLATQRLVDRVFQHEILTTVVPKGLPLYEVDSTFSPFKNIGRMKQLGKTMQSLGNVSVVNAIFHLNTEKMTAINNFLLVKNSEEDRTFGLSISPLSHVDFIPFNKSNPRFNPGPYASFTFKTPVQDTTPIGTGSFEMENYGTQVLGAALKYMSGGAPNIVRLRKYTVAVEPETFSKTSLLDASTEMVLASVK
jgi:hypothetical protein